MSTAVPLQHTPPGLEAAAINRSTAWLERNLLPDWLIRIGIRRLLAARLHDEAIGGVEAQQDRLRALIADLRRSPIAIATTSANAQHYEVPARFFELVLGANLKYSSGLLGR